MYRQENQQSNMESQEVHPLGPFDVTLLAKDGREFKAHRHVLSEASPFFQKLLHSDMKENKQGVVRLEVLNELLMKEILGFIYTGDVESLSEENAEELITAGDYLCLQNLKAVAGKFLERSMTTSNCVSTYYFAGTYHCDELAAKAKTFIQSNFAIVAKSEEFLNLTSHEVEDWISSDEITINAEEDVFNIIVGWIAKRREMRNGKFEELFRHVRLHFASRDFLLEELVTNDLVQQNESCMHRVTQAVDWIDRPTCCDPPSPKSPRKIFESDFLVAYKWHGESQACYVLDDDKWYQLPEAKFRQKVTCCDGKPHAIADDLSGAERYEPLYDKWVSLEWADGSEFLELDKFLDPYMLFEYGVCGILWDNGEIFAVVSDMLLKIQPKFLKYNLKSNSWKSLPFSFLAGKHGVCAVALNKHIYVVGGYGGNLHQQVPLNDAARFDTENNRWEVIATIQEARSFACGAAVNGKVYIAGGMGAGRNRLRFKSCEVYDEMTNEWCFIASLTVPRVNGSMLCVGGTLYVLGGSTSGTKKCTVECYDYERDEWRVKTTLPSSKGDEEFKACSVRLWKGALSERPQVIASTGKDGERQVKKCCIT